MSLTQQGQRRWRLTAIAIVTAATIAPTVFMQQGGSYDIKLAGNANGRGHEAAVAP